MKYTKDNTIAPTNGPLPKDNYLCRVLSAEHLGVDSDKYRSDGYEMTKLTCEIVRPERITLPSGEVAVTAGRQFYMNLTFSEKTAGTTRAAIARMIGADESTFEVDTDDKDAYLEQFNNAHFNIILDSKEDVKRMRPKPGQRVGDPIKDAFGKDIKQGWQISAWPSDVISAAPVVLPPNPY